MNSYKTFKLFPLLVILLHRTPPLVVFNSPPSPPLHPKPPLWVKQVTITYGRLNYHWPSPLLDVLPHRPPSPTPCIWLPTLPSFQWCAHREGRWPFHIAGTMLRANCASAGSHEILSHYYYTFKALHICRLKCTYSVTSEFFVGSTTRMQNSQANKISIPAENKVQWVTWNSSLWLDHQAVEQYYSSGWRWIKKQVSCDGNNHLSLDVVQPKSKVPAWNFTLCLDTLSEHQSFCLGSLAKPLHLIPKIKYTCDIIDNIK